MDREEGKYRVRRGDVERQREEGDIAAKRHKIPDMIATPPARDAKLIGYRGRHVVTIPKTRAAPFKIRKPAKSANIDGADCEPRVSSYRWPHRLPRMIVLRRLRSR